MIEDSRFSGLTLIQFLRRFFGRTYYFYRLHFRLYEDSSLLRSYANEISVLETSVTRFDIC